MLSQTLLCVYLKLLISELSDFLMRKIKNKNKNNSNNGLTVSSC